MNVVFIGYRCSGKTTISKLLESSLIGWKRVEIDDEIKKKFKLDIPEIIKKFGWKKFRKAESRLIKKYSKKNNLIIDAGGGAVLDPKNATLLKNNGIIINLNCSIESIESRMKKSFARPALTQLSALDEIKKVLAERLPLYKKYSDHSIKTDFLTLDQCVYLAGYFIKEEEKVSYDHRYEKLNFIHV